MADTSAPILWCADAPNNPGTWPLVKLRENGDGTYSVAVADLGGNYRNIAGAGTTTVKSGAGCLLKVICNKSIASSVVTIYDNTAASGAKIATITNPLALLSSNYELPYMARFANGLTIVTTGADDLTVVYI